MNVRIKKEFRSLLPACVLTAFAPLITMPLLALKSWNPDGVMGIAMFTSALGCVTMGTTVFGDEFQHRTLALLLVQPFPRRKIWREKLAVFGCAIAVCFVIFSALMLGYMEYFGDRLELNGKDVLNGFLVVALFMIGTFCTTPYWTLMVRSVVGGIVFSVIFPLALLMMIILLVDYFPGLKLSVEMGQELYLVLLTLGIYFAFCYWRGRRVFLRFQVVETQWQELKLPDQLEQALARPWKKMMAGRSGISTSLFNKEINLQRSGFILAFIYTVLFFAEAVVWKLGTSETAINTGVGLMTITFVIYFFLIPLIAGGVCIAEERNWGILGWQLCLPASKRRQWLVKISVALTTSLVLGIVLPIVVFEICKWLFHFPLNPFTNPDSPLSNDRDHPGILLWLLLYLTLPCMAILASSLSTNTMRAAVLGLLLAILGIGCIPPSAIGATKVAEYFFQAQNLNLSGPDEQVVYLLLGISAVMILGVILFLSFRNYANGEVSSRRRWLQPIILLLSISGWAFIFSFLLFYEAIRRVS